MPDATDWPYGTSPKPGEPTVVWLGEELVGQVLGDWAAPAGVLIPGLGQTAVDVTGLCSSPPNPNDALDGGELAAAVVLPFGMFTLPEKIVAAAKLAIWQDHCQFTPAPDPVAEPTPVYVPPEPPEVPPDTVLPPIGDLDPTYMVLKVLLDMKKQTDWLVDNTVTLDYVFGPQFDMVGKGDHYDEDAIGWYVHTIAGPAYLGHAGGNPRVTFSQGWIDFGDQNGWFDHRRLLHDNAVFFPCRFYTRMIGWDLDPNMVCWGRALHKGDGPHQTGVGG